MWKTLAALDLTFKKKSLRAAEQDRPDGAKARTEWRAKQPSLTPSRLVFIDETWIRTKMTRLCGPAPRRKRLGRCRVAWSLEDLDLYGRLRCNAVTATGVFDGAINGETFLDLRPAGSRADAEAGGCGHHG
jgi:hypothetical protein